MTQQLWTEDRDAAVKLIAVQKVQASSDEPCAQIDALPACPIALRAITDVNVFS